MRKGSGASFQEEVATDSVGVPSQSSFPLIANGDGLSPPGVKTEILGWIEEKRFNTIHELESELRKL